MPFEKTYLRERGSKKTQNSLFPIILFLSAIVLFGVYFWIRSVGDVIVKPGQYSLEKGSTLSSVREDFDMNIGEVRYKLWLKFFAPNLPKLEAGTYSVERATEVRSLFTKVLERPTHTDLTITILPGWNSYDIDDYLSRKNIIAPGAFLLAGRDHFADFQKRYSFLAGKQSLEGFLYPDTYRIVPTADSYMILERLLEEWQKKIGKSYEELGENAYKELILASIVEREERVASEKSIVADILAKRVRERIVMGADATVCYGYAKTQKQCTPEFIGQVIGMKHPYNTRNMQGYPPTPIASISLDTWNAVRNKKSSPYYYYLHDSMGVIHYAKTLEEHNQNKRLYLQ